MKRRLFMTSLLATSACAQDRPAAEGVHDLRVTNGELPAGQRRLTARQGDTVRLRITSDTRGQLHVHAYRMQAALGPGSVAELAFTANAAGRFPITWHPDGAPADAHEGPPLAMLEVQPR